MLPPKRAIYLALTEYNHILISLINSKFQTKTKLKIIEKKNHLEYWNKPCVK